MLSSIISNADAVSAFSNVLSEIFQDKLISEACEKIRQYNSETESIIFRSGIEAIISICNNIISHGFSPQSEEYQLMLDELQVRIIAIDKIVVRSCRGNRITQLNKDNIELIGKLLYAYSALQATQNESLGNIAAFILQSPN